jgi:iron complex transport system substrate-binding protein
MDAALAEMRANPAPGAPRVAAWDGSGSLPPRGSLYDAVITAAGARNVGREPALARGGFRMEALLASRPDYLLHDYLVLRTSGRQAQLVGHPLVRKLYADRQITIAQEQFVCGNPATAEAALALNRALRERAR